jgi:hypothetical protein
MTVFQVIIYNLVSKTSFLSIYRRSYFKGNSIINFLKQLEDEMNINLADLAQLRSILDSKYNEYIFYDDPR